MKRLVTAVVLLFLIVGISCFSLFAQERELGELNRLAIELRQTEATGQLEEKSEELFRLWNEKERLLVLFVRHDVLDELTVRMAQLPSLARHGEYGLFYSGVDVVLARMEDLLAAARPRSWRSCAWTAPLCMVLWIWSGVFLCSWGPLRHLEYNHDMKIQGGMAK